jgi:hypothetical protein
MKVKQGQIKSVRSNDVKGGQTKSDNVKTDKKFHKFKRSNIKLMSSKVEYSQKGHMMSMNVKQIQIRSYNVKYCKKIHSGSKRSYIRMKVNESKIMSESKGANEG